MSRAGVFNNILAAVTTGVATVLVGIVPPTTGAAISQGSVVAGTWAAQGSGTTADLKAVSCPSTTACYAVGAGGTIVATTDAGAHWNAQSSGTSLPLSAITCPALRTCYAIGIYDTILATTDGGTTWIVRAAGDINSVTRLDGISCASATICLILKNPQGAPTSYAPDTIVRTTDGWATSQLVFSADLAGLLSVHCVRGATACYVVGGDQYPPPGRSGDTSSLILGSLDSGATWVIQYVLFRDYPLYGVNCPAADTCYAFGGVDVLETTDGMTWSVVPGGHGAVGPDNATLAFASCPTPMVCMAIGAGQASVVLTTTAGATWSTSATGAGGLVGLAFPDMDHAWAVGKGGTIVAGIGFVAGCKNGSVTADKTSPQPGGTIITFIAASSGCASPKYEWWLWSARSGWTLEQSYANGSDQLVFNTAGMTPGTYTVDAWAEQSGSPFGTGGYETFGLMSWVVGGCNLIVANLIPNPSPATGVVHFDTAVGWSGWCAAPLYEFWLWSATSGWVLEQPYSSTGSWDLDTTTLGSGTYTVDVWIKQQGSPLAYEGWALSAVPKGACGSPKLTPSLSPPEWAGSTITLSTAASGCTSPLFRYWVYPPGGPWQMLRDYSSDGTIIWNTAGLKPGTYSLDVHVRQAGSTAAYDTFAVYAYGLTGSYSVTLSTAATSPQAVGSSVTFNATLSDTGSIYEFWLYQPGGPWIQMQAYSTTAGWTWDTSSFRPGVYSLVVWVRSQGSSSTFDSYATQSFTLV